MKLFRLTVVAAVCVLLTTGCIMRPLGSGTAGGAAADGGNGGVLVLEGIPAELAKRPDLSTLSKAIEIAELTEEFGASGPLTLFAPTDDAFAALPAGTLDALLLPKNKEALIKVLTYHLIDAEIPSYSMVDGDLVSREGSPVTITIDGSDVKVGDSTITEYDLYASNGLIDVVDKVLLPPDVNLK